MLVDLTLRGKVVLVLGSGTAARSRAATVGAEGARVVRAGSFGRADRPARADPRARGRSPSGELKALLRKVRPWAVFSTLDDPEFNRTISASARSMGILVHIYDAPSLSDFILPSVGTAGGLRIAVSTSGQSPAMAARVRRRLEQAVRPEDVLQVRLQGRLRKTILRTFPTFEARREVIYGLLDDREIRRWLRARRFDRAVAVARKRIASQRSALTSAPPKASR